MEGAPLSYTAADLKAIAASYDPETAPAPIVVGHPASDAPALGWAEKFDFDPETEHLSATIRDIEPAFAASVRAGRFRKVSMSFFPPHHPANPNPGSWYPRHIGFLGAASPAVPGLKNVAFSIAPADAITFSAEFAQFGDPGFERSASLFRRLRDFFIEKHGLEEADKALPSYEIEWLSEIETSRKPDDIGDGPGFAAGGFVSGEQPPGMRCIILKSEKEAPVPGEKPADFAAREAELTERERKIAERESAAAHSENASFAERMVDEGRLLPVLRDKVVALMDALPGHASVSFAAGDAPISPVAALREVLEAQPVVVTLGRHDLGQLPADAAATTSFAADGKPVDGDEIALHHKAEAYMREHPDTSYLDAVAAVSC
ncbi:hypothetical protein [Paenirhodobacter ferrireducens]|nr:hypothetical protein [Sinirhodobacter ferrireducens]